MRPPLAALINTAAAGLLVLLLAGCSLLGGNSQAPGREHQHQTDSTSSASQSIPQPQSGEAPAPQQATGTAAKPASTAKAFDSETLYSLLAAEFAGNRQLYDLALSNYAQQARQTRDPQVAARATLLARYLGATDTAVETAQIWLDSAPDDREALSSSAQALLAAGKLRAAFARLQQLLEQGDKPPFQLIAIQAAPLETAERQLLLEDFQQLLQRHPHNEQLLVGTGLLLEQQRQFQQALPLARKALKLHPQSLMAALLEANLLHQLKRTPEALNKMALLLQQHPNNHRLRQQYARILSHSDLAGAQEQFTLLSQQLPHQGDIWLSLGIVALQRQDYPSANRAFNTLLDLGQHQATAHYYLGQLAETQGKTQEALVHYQQVDGGNDFLSANLRLLTLLIQEGEYTRARQHINRLSLRYPEQAPLLWLLEAETLRKHQQIELAGQVLDEALRDQPDNIPLRYARAMHYDQQQQLAEAEQDLRHILALDADNSQALNALGYLLADRNLRLDEARQLISRALALNPEEPAIIDSMGWLEYRSGNLPQALVYLQRAYQLSGDGEIAAHLGEVLWVSGNTTEARRIWQQGLQQKDAQGAANPLLLRTLQRFHIDF